MQISGQTDGSFATESQRKGDHYMCIENNHDSVVEVGFAFRKNNKGAEDSKLSASISELLEGLQTLADHQNYMREREELHRDITESTNYRVLIWTIVEALTLALISVWQLMNVRKFFEVRRAI